MDSIERKRGNFWQPPQENIIFAQILNINIVEYFNYKNNLTLKSFWKEIWKCHTDSPIQTPPLSFLNYCFQHLVVINTYFNILWSWRTCNFVSCPCTEYMISTWESCTKTKKQMWNTQPHIYYLCDLLDLSISNILFCQIVKKHCRIIIRMKW